MEHATHDPRNEKDPYAPVGAIYKLDTRTGWAEFLDLIQPTARGTEHEITTLKRQSPEDLSCGATKGKHTLMTYDSAVIDFRYAFNLKQSKSIYILTRSKDNHSSMSRNGKTTLPSVSWKNRLTSRSWQIDLRWLMVQSSSSSLRSLLCPFSAIHS